MWSGDSTTTPDELERAVVESGLDVLCITDHKESAGPWSCPAACRAG
jgi:histidinol phosphatase-like PHP family hydrolase